MAREPFNEIWANDPDPAQFEEPPSTTFETGWEGGADKDPPQAKWENWWHNRVDEGLQDVERDGAMEWHSDTPYTTNAKARGSDGNNYTAIQDNTGFDPVLDDGTNWARDRVPSSLGFDLSQNGYYSLPGGLIVQWCSALVTVGPDVGDFVDVTISLPLSTWTTFLQGIPGQGFRGETNPAEPDPQQVEEIAEMSIGIRNVTQNDVTLRVARVLGTNPGAGDEQTEASVILLFKE